MSKKSNRFSKMRELLDSELGAVAGGGPHISHCSHISHNNHMSTELPDLNSGFNNMGD